MTGFGMITVERVGGRSYLRGDTGGVGDILREAGCRWDDEARAWWVRSHYAALQIADRANALVVARNSAVSGKERS
jgi:hypothetical protein